LRGTPLLVTISLVAVLRINVLIPSREMEAMAFTADTKTFELGKT
jgi:hypothetical protein